MDREVGRKAIVGDCYELADGEEHSQIKVCEADDVMLINADELDATVLFTVAD